VFEWSQALAGRVIKEAGPSETAQIDRVYQILYSRSPDKRETAELLGFLNAQEAVIRKQLASDKARKPRLPEGYGVKPEVTAQIDAFYKKVFNRAPDRFEQASFVQHLDKQQEQAAKAKPAGGDDEDDTSTAAAGAKKGGKGEPALNPARATAFVDMVHALANSNQFNYRF
jgi:hypothetical protein